MQAIEETDDIPKDLSSLFPSSLLSSLSNHEDAISWINEVLHVDSLDLANKPASATALTDLDKRVTNLVGTLELASEDTSLQVERIIDDISRGASRLTYDLHFMRDGALSLQSLLQTVEHNTKTSLSPDTNAALDRLHFLDTVKRNMEAAREVLREAESWSTLESDVTSLLVEQNYERAAERLSEANKSMVVFQNTPEFENRRTLMVSLQNQLEASLSSALVAAVNSQDVAVCKDFFSIFRNIQRESEFRNYYYGSRKAPLVEMWQNARLKDIDSGSGGASTQTFAQFLPTFYASFLTMLSTERTSISAIFPDPQPTLSTLITSTISSLQPTFSERLAAVNAYHGAKSLPQIIAAYQATQEFAVSADKILEKIGFSSTQLSTVAHDPDANETKKLRRRSSTRMSISRRIGPHRASISNNPLSTIPIPTWDSDLVEPFLDYQLDYHSLEKRFLLDTLSNIFVVGEDVRGTVDKARLLRERMVDVFGIADEAVGRCLGLTVGYGAVGLVRALETFFEAFIDKSKADVSSSSSSSTSTSTSTSTSQSGGMTTDLSDLDYTSEDWTTIQTLLHTLQAVRTLHDKLLSYENRLRTALIGISHTFRLGRADPVGFHPGGMTRGMVRVLEQSTLNSVELHELLGRVDPDQPLPTSARFDQGFLTPGPGRTPSTTSFPVSLNGPLLVDSRESVAEFAKHCQVALQDVILSPLRKRLSTYASLPIWSSSSSSSSTSKQRGGGAKATSAVSVPTFSLSPSETMQRLTEGLLNLPRLFEVYADDDALSFSIETLPFIRGEMLKALSDANVNIDTSPGHSRRTASLSMKAPPPPTTSIPLPPSQLSLPPEAVSAAWLSSLGLSFLAYLTSTVLPSIRTLSVDGAAQLASDLGYLSSVVMALNVEDGELDRWKEVVEMEDGVGRERFKEFGSGGGGRKEGERDRVLGVVGRLRGWAM